MRLLHLTTATICSLALASSSAQAQANPKPTHKSKRSSEPFWDYPELLAVPSASTLVRDYAKDEPSRSFASYLPLQVMGLANIITGARALGEETRKDDSGKVTHNPKLAGQIAIGIGLATIGGTYLLSDMYTPYRSGVVKLRGLPSKSPKARLAKEREAEHIIHNAATSASSVRLIGVLANLAGAGMVLAHTDDTNTRISAGLTALSAIGPFMFTPYQVELPGRYDGYKKRIYGPISYLSPEPSGFAGNFGMRLLF